VYTDYFDNPIVDPDNAAIRRKAEWANSKALEGANAVELISREAIMAQQAVRFRGERLVDEFVESLTNVEGLDSEVVALIQRLHQRGRLGSRNLLRELANQREGWEHAEAS